MAPDHPRESGQHPDDVTSFLPSQKSWGPDRNIDWPQVQDNVLHRMERNGYPVPSYNPEIWYRDGRIVLDSDNHPILTYRDLPATISSAYSGQDQETVRRLDGRITLKDIRARMPNAVQISKSNKNTKPLCSLSALGMRMTRFRESNGMIAWKDREGGDSIREYWINRMPEANRLANSTQGMPRPTRAEIRESKLKNLGKFPSRAGGRALSEKTRKERNETFEKQLEKLKEIDQTPEVTAGSSRKRRRRNSVSPVNGKQRNGNQEILPGFENTYLLQQDQALHSSPQSQYPDPTIWNQLLTEPWSASTPPQRSVPYKIRWAPPLGQDSFGPKHPKQPKQPKQSKQKQPKPKNLETPEKIGLANDLIFGDLIFGSIQDFLFPESSLSALENQAQANMPSDVWPPLQKIDSYADSSQPFSQTFTDIQPEMLFQLGIEPSNSEFLQFPETLGEGPPPLSESLEQPLTYPLLDTFPFVDTNTADEFSDLNQNLKDWLAEAEKNHEEELRLQAELGLEAQPEPTKEDVTSNQTNNQTSQTQTEANPAGETSELDSWEDILNQFVVSDPSPDFEPIP